MTKLERTRLACSCAALALLFLLVWTVADYRRTFEENVRAEAVDRADILADMRKASLDASVEERFVVLEAIAAHVGRDTSAVDAVANALRVLDQSTLFDMVGYVDDALQYTTNDGMRGVLTPDEYDAQLGEGAGTERTLVYVERETTDDLFVMTVPVRRDEVSIGTLVGAYRADAFLDSLWTRYEGDNTYGFIAQADGHVMAHTDSDSYIIYTDNVLDFFSEAKLENGATLDAVTASLQNTESGVIAYSYGNQHRYAVYRPTSVKKWFLFVVTDGSLIDHWAVNARTRADELIARLALLAALLVVTMIVLIHMLRIQNMLTRNLSDQQDEYGKIVGGLSRTMLARINPETGDLSVNDAFEQHFGRPCAVTNINQMIDSDDSPFFPADAPMWRKLAQEMRRGVPKGRIKVRMTDARGVTGWYTVSYVCVYTIDKKAPFRIAGRIEPIPPEGEPSQEAYK